MDPKKKLLLTKLFCVITAFFTLLFTSRSSFLYITNNWNDVNSYFTMGKGMMNGLVIYRDLYDQKGPYLYLLNGLAYLISRKSFLGIFLFEVAAATVSLYYIFKTAAIFCKEKTAIILLPVVSALMYSSLSFYQGGAAEEYCLPLMICSLYGLLRISEGRAPKDGEEEDGDYPEKKMIRKGAFLIGIFAGITALVKYTLLGFYFGLVLAAFLFMIFAKEKLRDMAGYLLSFAVGAVIPFIPWLICFGINDALDDWYRCYVYNNIFHYSALSEHAGNLMGRLYELAKYGYWLVRDNIGYFILILAGFAGLLFGKGNIIRKLFLPFIFAATFFVIFFGGNTLPYYSIPLMAFCGAGAGAIGKLIDLPVREWKPAVFRILLPVVLVLSVVFAMRHCISFDYLKQSREDFWLMKFRDIVMEEKDPTLLNVGGVDGGLYTVTGIVPTCEYFQTNGIDLPVMFEEQMNYIREGRTTFILVCNHKFEHIDLHYDQVAEASYEGVNFYLYKKVR
ncbi:MAG: hypothetical protein K6F53_12130 [Lachnospiraceae bacterium]|nr:hypothetical protein [Lachnospiraceae bacterium]